jgi:ubiquinone/menaquinone biosynthesis C-methylase UbiE
MMNVKKPKLYSELAGWWQVFSPTADYVDEAAFFHKLFAAAGAKTLLELGAGGGNIAFYLKKDFTLTLTDIAPEMIEMSKLQNPECEHVIGDMRSLSLDKSFDGVFIHDAIMYMLDEDDLSKVFNTAYRHCNPGGLVVVAPDCTKETFQASTDYEGHDAGNRSVRYLQWITDDNPDDTIFNYDFIIALKEKADLRTVVDRQICGVFSRQTWLDLLEKAGFTPEAVPDTSTEGEVNERVEVFIGYKK